MIRTPSIADSILSTTARDWGLAPRQPPGDDAGHRARAPAPADAQRAPRHGADRQYAAVPAQ